MNVITIHAMQTVFVQTLQGVLVVLAKKDTRAMEERTDMDAFLSILSFQFQYWIVVHFYWYHMALFWSQERNLVKMREKFFHQNGGLLLKQQTSSIDRLE